MRVLVTGGAGFIGSHIVDALRSAGHEPSVVDDLSSGNRANLPADVPFYAVDVRSRRDLAEAFDEARPQWVCHQAAQMSVSRSVREPAFDAEVNVLGLLNVLDHSVRAQVSRLVFASSGGVLYGDVFEPADEETPADPISPYGISKWLGEKYLQFFAREHGMQTVALRYSNVYGPRQSPHGEAGVVAIFAQLMLAGKQATINGDGSIVRDFVYVGDVARANLLALQTDLSQPFSALNIGTGEPATVGDLAANMLALCAAERRAAGHTAAIPDPKHGPDRPGDLKSSLVDASLASKLLGWRSSTPLESGLRQTVEWFAKAAEAHG